jgi:hypothetical protein
MNADVVGHRHQCHWQWASWFVEPWTPGEPPPDRKCFSILRFLRKNLERTLAGRSLEAVVHRLLIEDKAE